MKLALHPTLFTQLGRATQLVLLLMAAFCTNNVFAAGGGGASAATTGKVNYFPIEPAFVVNIQDNRSIRFMQIGVNLMTMDAEVVTAVQKHMAPIRHELIMLFSSRELSEVMSPPAREVLRQEALLKIQEVLGKYADISISKKAKDPEGKEHPSSVQEVLFTSFVIQ